MEYLDLSFSSPAMNLALDEALLDQADAGELDGALRFWESSSFFVVLGYGNHLHLETRPERCKADAVPILRRCSGGGAVLQGPGCLNYSIVLPIDRFPECEGIVSTNKFIMGRMKEALGSLSSSNVEVRGYTDLCLGAVKFSGNAQRRKKKAVLFHGTMLYQFDLATIPLYLAAPSKQPDYRQGRVHLDFIVNFEAPAEAIRLAIRDRWDADKMRQLDASLYSRVEELFSRCYGLRDWNEKF
ncbi:MAG: lipoate--protein ligase family protein [Verrucomicrobiales bacterium]|nr:lipoate--protein ligase family protein [Verrucomicrobiales bacterium]